jgi:hypothetical protein
MASVIDDGGFNGDIPRVGFYLSWPRSLTIAGLDIKQAAPKRACLLGARPKDDEWSWTQVIPELDHGEAIARNSIADQLFAPPWMFDDNL